MKNHRQVPIRVRLRGTLHTFEVDEAMHDPIVELWQAGIPTLYSCQGGPLHFDNPTGRDTCHGYLVLSKEADVWPALTLLGWDRPGLVWIVGGGSHDRWVIRFPDVLTMDRYIPVP